MDTTMQDLVSDALDECKKGGNPAVAQALATLAVAQAIADLATAVADRPGVDPWHPFHIQEQGA
jgi:hypothetical protein